MQTSKKIYEVLAEFHNNLKQPLPVDTNDNHTNLLDVRMREMRENEFIVMKREIEAMLERGEKDKMKEIVAKLDDYLCRIKYLCVEVSIVR